MKTKLKSLRKISNTVKRFNIVNEIGGCYQTGFI